MFGHRYRYIYMPLLAGYSFLNIILLNGDRLYTVGLPWYELLLIIGLLVFCIWEANRLIEQHIVGRIRAVHLLISQIIVSVATVIAISFVSVWLTFRLLGNPYHLVQENFLLTLAFSFRVNLFLNSVNAIVFFNLKYREKQLEAARYRTQSAQAQLAALSNQVSPHFFFNSLNVLLELVQEDADEAEAFIYKLSEVYRYTLQEHPKVVPLQQELDFLRQYLDLLKVRFDNALQVELQIDDQLLGFLIPPLALQMLVENAVKHNAFTQQAPLLLRLMTQGTSLLVHNTRQPKQQVTSSLGLGLNNIRGRYEFLEEEIHVEATEHYFSVSLPLFEP